MGTHINQKTNLKDLDIKITKIYKDKLDNFRNASRNRNIHVRICRSRNRNTLYGKIVPR